MTFWLPQICIQNSLCYSAALSCCVYYMSIRIKHTEFMKELVATCYLFEQPLRWEKFPLQLQSSLALGQRFHPLQGKLISQTLCILTADRQTDRQGSVNQGLHAYTDKSIAKVKYTPLNCNGLCDPLVISLLCRITWQNLLSITVAKLHLRLDNKASCDTRTENHLSERTSGVKLDSWRKTSRSYVSLFQRHIIVLH